MTSLLLYYMVAFSYQYIFIMVIRQFLVILSKEYLRFTFIIIFCLYMLFVKGSKIVAGGLATIAISGAGIGIGIVFGCLILGVSYNPKANDQLFGYAILGFALTESIALFGLMMSFLLLYGSF